MVEKHNKRVVVSGTASQSGIEIKSKLNDVEEGQVALTGGADLEVVD